MNSTNTVVRFDAPTSAPQKPPSTMTNKNINKFSKWYTLNSASTFIVTLCQYISPITQKLAESYIDLLHKLINKMNQLNKLDGDSDYIPRSI